MSMSPTSSAPTAASTKKLEREIGMSDLKFSGRKIMEQFYTQLVVENHLNDGNGDGFEEASGLRHFKCRCGKVRIQNIRHGYTNLKHHVLLKHPEWLRDIVGDIQQSTSGSTTKPASPSSLQKNDDAEPEDSVTKKRKASELDEDSDTTSENNRTMMEEGQEGDEQQIQPPRVSPVPQRRRGRPAGVKNGTSSKTPAKLKVEESQLNSSSSTGETSKRSNYISWDDYFMSVAFLSAMRSKDPSTQVGACIVNTDKKIVGIGYNGFPNGCSDDILPWARTSTSENPLETKYPYVCHAEMNAILNKNTSDLRGCTMYVALFPCNDCAKLIIQCGIKHIVYYSDKYHDDWKFIASRRLLDMAGIKYRLHQLTSSKLVIDFTTVLS